MASALLGLVLAGCSTSHSVASLKTNTHRHEAAPTTPAPTTSAPSTRASPSEAPTLVGNDYYQDTHAAGGPGYYLVISSGPPGSGILGGLALYEYPDGKETSYFSFHGRAVSGAPFTMNIKGDPAATTATFQVTPNTGSDIASSITIDNCSQLFSPAVPNDVPGEPAPPSPPACGFSYNLAPFGSPLTQSTVPLNLVATPTLNDYLLDSYLAYKGWQSQYGSLISLLPGGTYVAFDPQTGLDWAFANFEYSGPATSTPGSPSVAMQDGGSTGIFYQYPTEGTVPYSGWAMVGASVNPPATRKQVSRVRYSAFGA